MALAFRSASIPGTHGEMQFGQWEVQVSRTRFNSVKGVSEQRGERGGRTITFESWWHNAYATAALLEAAVELLSKDCPINGDLVETGTMSRTFTRCTLEAIVIKRGPIYGGSSFGWFYIVEFHFFQLSPT